MTHEYAHFAPMLDRVLNGDLRGKNRKIGFAVFLFPFGSENSASKIAFLSNAERPEVLELLQYFLDNISDYKDVMNDNEQ